MQRVKRSQRRNPSGLRKVELREEAGTKEIRDELGRRVVFRENR
jgi:hypothetical protein